MKPFKAVTGLVAPLDRLNVDTDQIVPKQFLKLVQRTGFGKYLFYDWRFDLNGNPKPDFELNKSDYQGASILLTRDNFGCGSSREHAVWAIEDYGFKAVIAPSFADIFYNNCFKNGVLPVVLKESEVSELFAAAYERGKYHVTVNLAEQVVEDGYGRKFRFEIDAYLKKRMLEGLDDIGLTLLHEDKIKRYEQQERSYAPAPSA